MARCTLPNLHPLPALRLLLPLLLPLLLAATPLLWPGPVSALGDPTRPSERALPRVAATPAAAAAAAAASAAAVAPVPPPVLQSIHLRRGGEASALVDGRLLRVGDKLGEATITAIDADGLTLRHARGTERLPMWPSGRLNSTSTPSNPPSAVSTAGSRSP